MGTSYSFQRQGIHRRKMASAGTDVNSKYGRLKVRLCPGSACLESHIDNGEGGEYVQV